MQACIGEMIELPHLSDVILSVITISNWAMHALHWHMQQRPWQTVKGLSIFVSRAFFAMHLTGQAE